MSTASQARRRKGPDELEIIAFERGRFTSYSSCGIPYLTGGTVTDVGRLVVRTPEQFAEKQSIDARIRHEVISVDAAGGAVTVRDLERGTEEQVAFDHLMIATGAVQSLLPLPGADSEGIFGVQTLDDGIEIIRELDERKPSRAVVVGGGYIGLEMAEAMTLRGLHVTLVESAAQPMSATLDSDMGALVADAMRSMGIDVLTEEPASGFEASSGRVTAVVTDDRTLPADIVILGLGSRPNAALAETAGIALGESGGIRVNERMETTAERVWAAGDCAEKRDRLTSKGVSIALGTHANKEGRVAGINITGGNEHFPGVIGTAVTKVCDLEIGRTGLKEDKAEAAGFDVMSVTVDSVTRAGYFPGKEPIKVKMIFERDGGRLLGAQILGRESAAKRIDVCATAIWSEMSVQDVMEMDLSYAPPFSPLWDPVSIAARKAVERLGDA